MLGAAKSCKWLLLSSVLFLAGCANSWSVLALVETEMVQTRAPALAAELARGREHLAAGRYGLASASFRNAIKADPNSINALNGLAATYDRIGRYDLATSLYERALALDPRSAQTLNNIGFSHMLRGNFDIAIVFLRDAQQHDRIDPFIAANRAIAEAALRARQPRPAAQWHAPSDRDDSPLPRAWVERTTPLVQTLATRLTMTPASAGASATLTLGRPAGPFIEDTLPGMLAAPIGDTRLSAGYDRLRRPISASMADAWAAPNPTQISGGENTDSPG